MRIMRRGWFPVSILLVFILLTSNSVFGQSAEGPEPPDWFAGDAHVHRGIGCGRSNETEMLSPQQLLDMMDVNNLAVISVLADAGNGEIKFADQDLAMINGQDNSVSTPQRIVHWDAEWHYDPEGVTFERKMIGGHLILLGLKQGGQPFAQYTYPIFEWAKKQGGIAGFAHMQYLPFAFYPPPDGIPTSLDCCAPLEYPVETALGSASFLMEDVHGSDSALQAYYRILNTGFRPGLAASTDYSCNDNEPLGTLLTYVRIPDGHLTYDKWIEGLANGRTVVSRNAHNEFLDLKVNGTAQPGDEIRLEGNGPGAGAGRVAVAPQQSGQNRVGSKRRRRGFPDCRGGPGLTGGFRNHTRLSAERVACCPANGLAGRPSDAYRRGVCHRGWRAHSCQRRGCPLLRQLD